MAAGPPSDASQLNAADASPRADSSDGPDSGGKASDAAGRRDATADAAEAGNTVDDASSSASDAVIDVAPCPGFSLQLNGSNYVSVARPVRDDFTLEAWVRVSSSLIGTTASQGRGIIYADVGGSNNDFATSVLNDRLAFSVGNPDITVESVSNIATGAWVHVAVTRQRSSGQIQLFVNGVRELTATAGNTGSLDNPASMLIGGNNTSGNPGGNLIGDIDEVRAWSIVRSASEIATTMHQRLTGTETGLVGYWRMDTPGRVADSAGTNTGSLVGPLPTWVQPDATCSP